MGRAEEERILLATIKNEGKKRMKNILNKKPVSQLTAHIDNNNQACLLNRSLAKTYLLK